MPDPPSRPEPLPRSPSRSTRACLAGGALLWLLQGCLISPKDYPLDESKNGSSGSGGNAGGDGKKDGAGGDLVTAGNAGAGGAASAGSAADGGSSGSGGSNGDGGSSGSGSGSCSLSADCDDDDDCTTDVCNDGTCRNTPIALPDKSVWVTTASVFSTAQFCGGDLTQVPANATDGNLGTRWSTGVAQAGDEWLEVDFGSSVTLSTVTLDAYDPAQVCGGPEDYPRYYQARLSNTSLDFDAPILAEGEGMLDLTTIEFSPPAVGRYLLISQTGVTSPSWWSIAELDAACR